MVGEYIELGEKRYDLSHLDDFHFEASRPDTEDKEGKIIKGWTIPIQVFFSWHCYTKKPDENETSKIFDKKGEKRCFCPVRYEYSRQLPDIVHDLIERKIFQTGKGNYITIEKIDAEGNSIEYEIYFSLKKRGKRQPLRLFIESAYLRTPSTSSTKQKRKRRPIRFRILVYNIHHEKGIRYTK